MEGPAWWAPGNTIGEPALRTREELRQGSAWMDIVYVQNMQGPLQALNSRRQRILQDPRYLLAPDAINRVMAYSLAFADVPETAAGGFAFAIDLELEYLMDHFHARVFSGLTGSTYEHDPDIYDERQANYASLASIVQEFAMLATYIGGTCRPGDAGMKLVAAQTIERELRFTTDRLWPDITVGPEVTCINPHHLIDLMVDQHGLVVIPQDDESDSSSSSDAHEGL